MTDWIKDAGWLSELRRVGGSGTDEAFDSLVRDLVAAAVAEERATTGQRIEALLTDWLGRGFNMVPIHRVRAALASPGEGSTDGDH